MGRPSAMSCVGERGDRLERREIESPHLDEGTGRPLADSGGGRLALLEIADRHDDLGSGARESRGDLEADSVGGAGDERERSGEVRDGDVEGLRHGGRLQERDAVGGASMLGRTPRRHSGRAYPGIRDPWVSANGQD